MPTDRVSAAQSSRLNADQRQRAMQLNWTAVDFGRCFPLFPLASYSSSKLSSSPSPPLSNRCNWDAWPSDMLQALPPNRISLYLLLLPMALMSLTVMLFLMLTYARYKHRWPRQLIIEGVLLLPLTMAPLMMFVIMTLLRLVTAKTAPPLPARQ